MTPVIEKTTSYPVAKSGANGHAPKRLNRDELIAALMREEGKAEIIHGRIVRFMATGRKPGYAGDAITVALWLFVKANKPNGMAVGDNKGFLCYLPHRESFSPDTAYYMGEDSGANFYPTSPVFAVEVRSEGDYGAAVETEMQAKRADYFAYETEVVWDVDVLKGEEIVRKFTKAGGAANPVAVFKRGETADAEPAVPGFSMPVDDLFQ